MIEWEISQLNITRIPVINATLSSNRVFFIMFNATRLTKRILAGLWIGLFAGLTFFFTLPKVAPDIHLHFVLAMIIWHTTFGSVIATAGIFDEISILKCRLPWWLRGPGTGAWMNSIIVLFAPRELLALSEAALVTVGAPISWASPWWFAPIGALLGLVIDGILTKRYWDGSLLFKADQ